MDLIEYGKSYYQKYWWAYKPKNEEDFIERICIIAADFPDKDNDWICQQASKN